MEPPGPFPPSPNVLGCTPPAHPPLLEGPLNQPGLCCRHGTVGTEMERFLPWKPLRVRGGDVPGPPAAPPPPLPPTALRLTAETLLTAPPAGTSRRLWSPGSEGSVPLVEGRQAKGGDQRGACALQEREGMWDLGSGTLGVATCWAGPTSQSGLGGAALLLARGNFLACAASSGPTEARDGKGRRRQKGNPVREQMPLSGVWEDLFFQLSLPPRPPPRCRTRALPGFGGLALLDPPHPALCVGSVAVQVPIGFPPNKGWYFSSVLRGDVPTPHPRDPSPQVSDCLGVSYRCFPETIEMCFPESPCHS